MNHSARIRLAVFDCDGTLVDSQHAIVASMAAAFGAEKLEPPEARRVREVIGLPLAEAIARLLPEADDDDHGRLVGHYQDAFQELRRRPDHEEPLYPGTVEALDALEAMGMLLGVATGKGRRGLDMTLRRHGIEGRFATLKTSDDGPGKPHPDMLRQAMGDVGAEAADTVMIGDTTFDMSMAGAASVASIGVSWGYHTVEALREAGAGTIVERYDALPPAVESLLGGD